MPKFTSLIFLLSISLIACVSSENEDSDNDMDYNIEEKPISQSENKILILGASRVEGNRPDYESFRYALWKKLKADNQIFDFIGTQSDTAQYPTVDGEQFDVDHEGRGGWTSGQIDENLDNWLQSTGAADIVLFSSPAGNDALEGLPYAQAIININSIIDRLQNDNPDITIFIEQMAPTHSDFMTTNLRQYLTDLQQEVESIAIEKTNGRSKMIVVDMYSDFNDSLFADDVHYNLAGAEFIAERYYQALIEHLQP